MGEGSEVLQMSEGTFVEHLADYPEMELSWLQQLYESSTCEVDSVGASLNNMMGNMLMPSLSGFTKKVRPAATWVPAAESCHGRTCANRIPRPALTLVDPSELSI